MWEDDYEEPEDVENDDYEDYEEPEEVEDIEDEEDNEEYIVRKKFKKNKKSFKKCEICGHPLQSYRMKYCIKCKPKNMYTPVFNKKDFNEGQYIGPVYDTGKKMPIPKRKTFFREQKITEKHVNDVLMDIENKPISDEFRKEQNKFIKDIISFSEQKTKKKKIDGWF